MQWRNDNYKRKIEGIDVFLMLIKNGDTIVAKVMSNVSEIADKL